MIDLIKTILTSDAGSVTFVAALVLCGCWLVYYATKRITEISKDNEFINGRITDVAGNMEKKILTAVDTMDRRISDAVDTMDRRISDATDTMDRRMSDAIDGMDRRMSDAIDGMDRRISDATDTMDRRMSDAIDGMDKKISDATDTMGEKFTYVTSNLERRTDKIEGYIDEIRKDISFLKGALDIVKKANKNTLMQAHSPISLTEKGNEVSKELAVDDMLTRNWEVVYNLLEKEIKDKNPYDIQQSCIEELTVAPDKYLLPEDLLKVKNYAYNTGEPLALYTRLIAIVLRDRYFIAKGIEIADIDVHDPSKSESE